MCFLKCLWLFSQNSNLVYSFESLPLETMHGNGVVYLTMPAPTQKFTKIVTHSPSRVFTRGSIKRSFLDYTFPNSIKHDVSMEGDVGNEDLDDRIFHQVICLLMKLLFYNYFGHSHKIVYFFSCNFIHFPYTYWFFPLPNTIVLFLFSLSTGFLTITPYWYLVVLFTGCLLILGRTITTYICFLFISRTSIPRRWR